MWLLSEAKECNTMVMVQTPMQTLVQIANKHGCPHKSPDSLTRQEGLACGEITNAKMRPFLVNISHPGGRHLIPKDPAEEERLYNSNPAYKKASDEHDEFSVAFQAVYPIGGRRTRKSSKKRSKTRRVIKKRYF